jgi:GAF domain-containing protein
MQHSQLVRAVGDNTGTAQKLKQLAQFDPAWDRTSGAISGLAADLLGMPYSPLSIIDDVGNRPLFKSYVGLVGDLASKRETVLAQSQCKHVRNTNIPLILSNASTDDRFRDHPAHTELGIRSYLGHPVHLPCGAPIGALCTFSMQPRVWQHADVSRLGVLALCFDAAIQGTWENRNALEALEAVKRAAAARSCFLAGLNHEVRTSLNGVLGIASALSDTLKESKAEILVKEITRSGERMHYYLIALIGLTEINSKFSDSKASVSIQEVLEQVLAILRLSNPAGALTLTNTTEQNCKYVIMSDMKKLRQICYDLFQTLIMSESSWDVQLNAEVTCPGELAMRIKAKARTLESQDVSSGFSKLDVTRIQNQITSLGGWI